MTTTTELDLGPAAAEVARVVAAVGDEQLTGPTPCADTSLAALLDHVLGLALAFTRAAQKRPLSAAPVGSADHLPDDWRSRLPAQLDELVAAWRAASAWEGVAEAGGVTLPAPVMARVALDELVVHGWDVAAAIGAPYRPDPVSVQECLEFVGDRSDAPADEPAGLFGPAVPVPADSPALHRLLGQTGRDPRWAPPISG